MLPPSARADWLRPASIGQVERDAAGRWWVAVRPDESSASRDSTLLLRAGDSARVLSFANEGAPGLWVFGEPEPAVISPPPQATTQPALAPPIAYWVDTSGLRAALAGGPRGAEFFASIDAISPGQISIWIDHSTAAGAQVGDSWWLRVDGQPAARFETLLATPQGSFARVFPLAADVRLRRGGRLALWPSPAEEATGRRTSSVSNVEQREGLTLAWIARPPGPPPAAEAHVEFRRAGELVAWGAVERTDPLFTYVRLLAAAPGGEATVATGLNDAASLVRAVRVGDVAQVRTPDDILARDYKIRIFASAPNGFLINAGEPEGLQTNQSGRIRRGSAWVSSARVVRLQRGYSVVQPEPGSAPPLVGDEFVVSEGSADGPIEIVGRISGANDPSGAVLSVRLEDDAQPGDDELFAIYAGGRTIGVGCLIPATRSSPDRLLFSLPESRIAPVPAGAVLVRE